MFPAASRRGGLHRSVRIPRGLAFRRSASYSSVRSYPQLPHHSPSLLHHTNQRSFSISSASHQPLLASSLSHIPTPTRSFTAPHNITRCSRPTSLQSASTLSSSSLHTPLHYQSRRHIMGIWQNARHMDWGRIKRNWSSIFVWSEEYGLGRYRADQKRMLWHARRTGGVTPPFDYEKNRYMTEHEFLNILEAERIERFKRLNIWRKATVIRRWAVAVVIRITINIFNRLSDFVTRFLGRLSVGSRGRRFRLRKIFIWRFMSGIKWPTQMLARVLSSFFFRFEMQRTFTLSDLDQQMQNRVSGELLAKYNWPKTYSISKYFIAFADPLYSTFNWFHGVRLAILNVVWPLMRRWWFHLNDYKPYLGFVKFGVAQWALCFLIGMLPMAVSHFRLFDGATFAYKADFAHNYIALMTRAVYADVLIALIEDGLIDVAALTQGHDYEIHTKQRSAEFKFVDDLIARRCQEDPEYKSQLENDGVPLSLDAFFGVENIPLNASPKDQVLYILRQYNNYREITQDMLRQLIPFYQFNDRWCRIVFSLGLSDESSVWTYLLGTISSARVVLTSYRALLNIIGTRDGESFDPGVQHQAMIRALTRKFDLSVLPPTEEARQNMVANNRPYAKRFADASWDRWGFEHLTDWYSAFQARSDGRPGQGLDVYNGANPDHYDIDKHGEHQYWNLMPSVSNPSEESSDEATGANQATPLNVKGLGKALLDPYVSILLPSFHEKPLDYEMVVLQQIKDDLIKIASVHPEYKNNIPRDYDPFHYKHFIRNYLELYGHNKIEIWEAILSRDTFVERGFAPPNADEMMLKHGKWLHSQILACVDEKLPNFASPMYYIEGTCPPQGNSEYRSRVDTISRFITRNEIGRQVWGPQIRARDYQVIDPYAEEHVLLMREIAFTGGHWDVANFSTYDKHSDDFITPLAEDLGFWHGGKSILPFLGVNKYRGSNPMTGKIGMLVTSAENLMTVNRTAKERMIEMTDLAPPKFDPFLPTYRDLKGNLTNIKPDEDRFFFQTNGEIVPTGHKSNRMVIPTAYPPTSTSPDAPADATKPSVTSHRRVTTAEQEYLYRHLDHILHNDPTSSSSLSGLTGIIAPAFQHSLRKQVDTNDSSSQQQQQQHNTPDSARPPNNTLPSSSTITVSKPSTFLHTKSVLERLHNDISSRSPHDVIFEQYHSQRPSSSKTDPSKTDPSNSPIDRSFITDALLGRASQIRSSSVEPHLRDVVSRFNQQLLLHRQNPSHVPHPLPPRLPYERTHYLHDSQEELSRM